jgi:hypothetical protein
MSSCRTVGVVLSTPIVSLTHDVGVRLIRVVHELGREVIFSAHTVLLPTSRARHQVGRGEQISELAHRRALRIASTRGVPGDAWARQHKADDGCLLPRAAPHSAVGCRAHGRDAGLKGPSRYTDRTGIQETLTSGALE